MVRVKRGLMTKKRHRNMLKATKGYRLLNSRVFKKAKNAWMKAGVNAYVGRKRKKRDFRRLWNMRISAAVKELGLNYSTFINNLYKKRIKLNRKVLSNLAITHKEVFNKVVEFSKN